jgi:hypothetical protein
MHIIGQAKNIEELPLVSPEELDGLAKFIDTQIQQGTPLEVPQALSLRDLGRLLRTALHYRDQKPEAQETPRLTLPKNDWEEST